MFNVKNFDFIEKLVWFCFGGIIYFILLVALVREAFLWSSGIVLLCIPWLVVLSSVVGLGVWLIKYRYLFEALLVFFTYFGVGFAFIVMAPIAVDRSLSSFIFFYAVEHESFPQVELSSDYKTIFFQKRFDDAMKGNFLVKENDVYKPTFRAKLYYGLFYPLGMITNSLENYHAFAKEVDAVKNK